MSPELVITLDCPDCGTELTATWEPASSGAGEPDYGPSLIALEGCEHAEAYADLDGPKSLVMARALDDALEDSARHFADEYQAAREYEIERRWDAERGG